MKNSAQMVLQSLKIRHLESSLCFITLGVNRQKAQEWCIKHSFELVELSPEELPDEDGRVTSCYFYNE